MKEDKLPHYYGDTIRLIFVIGGIGMLLTLPVFQDRINLPIFISIIAMLGIGVTAGLTNPRQRWVIIFNAVASALGFFIFEYYAVDAFTGRVDLFFLANQFLALLFFIALYYSVKTLRGFTLFLN